jgi:hypothetical protein
MLSCFVLAAQAGRRGRTPLVSRTSAGHTGFEPAASILTGWHSNLTELMPHAASLADFGRPFPTSPPGTPRLGR